MGMSYIPDADRFCRVCRGSGSVREATASGTWVVERCYACGGSGINAIMVIPAAGKETES